MSSARTPAVLYSVEDLNILYQNRQFNEYLAHAKDIRPTERNANWKKQVLEMAHLYLDEALKLKNYSKQNYTQLNRIMGLGNVKENELFLLKRKDFIVGYLQECFKNQPGCVDLAKEILKQTPMKREFSDIPAAFGLEVLEHTTAPLSDLHPFFKYALISDQAKFLCQKPPVRRYIFNWFKEFNLNSRTSKEIKLFTADNFSPKCFESVMNHYITSFSDLTGPIDREQILNWIIATEYLSEAEIDTLLTIYLLKNPVNGDVFNLAWNRIQKLGEHFPSRQTVLKKLDQLDPLPDNIFGISDPLREKTLFNLVSKNLPEYIDSYAKNCINFYSGTGHFPTGNRTINCRHFYHLFKNKFGADHPKTIQLKQSVPL